MPFNLRIKTLLNFDLNLLNLNVLHFCTVNVVTFVHTQPHILKRWTTYILDPLLLPGITQDAFVVPCSPP